MGEKCGLSGPGAGGIGLMKDNAPLVVPPWWGLKQLGLAALSEGGKQTYLIDELAA